MQNNSSIMHSQLNDLITQFKMLPANQIKQGQIILDKFTNSRLSNYLTNQDISQINQSLRKKKSIGKNFGLFRKKTLGDLYPTLQQFQMQQQYHSQGFKKIKQTQRNLQIQKRQKSQIQRLKRQEQERIAEQTRLNLQRQIAQAKIVDKVLKVPSLPDNITYKSLQSMTYFENYRGFNNGGNAPGKNILNIGERHFGVDKGFTEFENFIDTLVAKNKYIGECLDLVYESDLENINELPLFQKKAVQLSANFKKLFFQQETSTLLTLRNLYKKNRNIIKGFRAHHTDTRLGFDGFNASLIKASKFFKFPSYINKLILKYIYDFYKPSEDQPSEDKTIIEMELFEFLLKINPDNSNHVNEAKTILNDIKLMYSQNPDIMGFYKRRLQYAEDENKVYKMFVVSIKNFVQKAVGQQLKRKRYILDENDMTVVNREMYYKYLEEKGLDRNYVEEKIFNNKRFDLKFKKQINNLDTRYFKSNPKKTIMLYYLQYLGMPDTANFYDINTICRVFRKFDESKERYSSCDQNDKSMRLSLIHI